MTLREIEAVIDSTLKAALGGARERSGGRSVRLRESADERAEDAAKVARKAERKQERKLFESLGMSREGAKRAAAAGMPLVEQPIAGRMEFSEAETKRLRESLAQRKEERKQEKDELPDRVAIFESLGMSKAAAEFAAKGR